MSETIDIWKLIAGLGLFLFGMLQIEEALKELGGRSFKLFLRKNTQNPFKAVLIGTTATAILQSSSVVSLIVMAFVGAGMITTRHALGIIFGSNLGTTFTGWVVATIGFKVNLEEFYLPLLGLSCLGLVFFQKKSRRFFVSQSLVGLGFLLMGLIFMKTSTELIAQKVDMAWLAGYPLIVFLLFGMILTAIINSSSATVMITLTALHTGLIDFTSACALVIGADLGTTITAVLGAIKGTPDKKRVALAHVLFNFITDSLAFLLLGPFIYLIQNIFKITDPLYALVVFHSTFNLMGVMIFLPSMKILARFLEKRFQTPQEISAKYIHQVSPEIPEAALSALRLEVQDLIQSSLNFNRQNFELKNFIWKNQKYEKIKDLEGEILNFSLSLQSLNEDESKKLDQLTLATRHSVHSTKCIKDIQHNLVEFGESNSNQVLNTHQKFKTFMIHFYQKIFAVMEESSNKIFPEASYQDLLSEAQEFHVNSVKEIYELVRQKFLSDIELSSFLNMNREIFSSNKALLASLQAFLANPTS